MSAKLHWSKWMLKTFTMEVFYDVTYFVIVKCERKIELKEE